MSWPAILILAAGSYALKAMGVLLGGRVTTPLLTRVIVLLPPALFAAVVALQTFGRNGGLVIDARVVGLIVAIIATWRRLPFIVIVAGAMAATALTRLVL